MEECTGRGEGCPHSCVAAWQQRRHCNGAWTYPQLAWPGSVEFAGPPGNSCPCRLLQSSGPPAAAPCRKRAAGQGWRGAWQGRMEVGSMAWPRAEQPGCQPRQCTCCRSSGAPRHAVAMPMAGGQRLHSCALRVQLQHELQLCVALAWPGRRSWEPPGMRIPLTACQWRRVGVLGRRKGRSRGLSHCSRSGAAREWAGAAKQHGASIARQLPGRAFTAPATCTAPTQQHHRLSLARQHACCPARLLQRCCQPQLLQRRCQPKLLQRCRPSP